MGVMQTSLSALDAYSLMLGVTSNNLANLNTAGFKGQQVRFHDAFYQSLQGANSPEEDQGGLNPVQVGTGTVADSVSTRFEQGAFSATGRPLDLAIAGDGFFAVERNGVTQYTRDGAFGIDARGNFVHEGTGAVLMGWQADTAGAVDSLAPPTALVMPTVDLAAQPTQQAVLGGNLDARLAAGESTSVSFTVYDSLGQDYSLEFDFAKVDNTNWNWSASLGGSPVGNGSVSFDGEGRSLTGTGTVSLTLANGAASPQDINVDLSDVTQLAADSTIGGVNQNGFAAGTLQNIWVDERGTVFGGFSNGVTRTLAQVAVTVFANPEGMERTGDSLFIASNNSGLPRYLPATQGGAGLIQSGGLEMSNADLATELTQVMVAQRGFQAAARLILTADELTQEALNLRR